MAQIVTKFIKNNAVTAPKLGSGAATSSQAAFADGSGNVAYRSILSGDVPILNQSTTGTAANVTATSNATLTTLSALTTASSLASVGTITSGVWNGTAIAIVNGGTGQNTAASAFAALSPLTTAGDLIYENATPAPARLPIGTTGQVLTVVGGLPAWSAPAVSPGSITLTQNHILVGNASNLAADVAMSGEASVVSSGAVTLSNAAVIAKVLTGYTSGAGTITSADSILSAIQKLNGNQALYLPLAGGTMSGAIAMGSNKITGLASGTTTGDALQWGQIGAANGIAPLDGSSKIPASYLPSVVMEYQQAWNPNTNTPALADGTGTNGFVYRVSTADSGTVAGLTDPSMVNFNIGDLIIYSGTLAQWQKAPAVDGVSSVNGAVGAVTVNAINQLTGDVTTSAASGSQSKVSALVATSNATLTTLSALTTASSLASVGTITSGVWNGTAVAIAHGGTGQTTAAAAFNALNPMTTTGDLIYESATNTASRLAIGTTGQVLTVVAGVPAWSATATTTTNGKDTFVLSSTDITNQFVTLSHTPLSNSTDLLVQGGGVQLEGSGYDYTVSGATIVFQNDLATGGVSALVAGDILQVQYEY